MAAPFSPPEGLRFGVSVCSSYKINVCRLAILTLLFKIVPALIQPFSDLKRMCAEGQRVLLEIFLRT